MDTMTKKILLIEDEHGLAKMYQDVFQREGYEVRLALTAEDGRKMLDEDRPDLVLLDILLPEKDGVTFLAELREVEEYKDLPVVILSNYDAMETRDKAEAHGIKAYLMKADYTPKALVEEIKKYL